MHFYSKDRLWSTLKFPEYVLHVLQDAGRNLKLSENANLLKVRFWQVSCGDTVKAVA